MAALASVVHLRNCWASEESREDRSNVACCGSVWCACAPLPTMTWNGSLLTHRLITARLVLLGVPGASHQHNYKTIYIPWNRYFRLLTTPLMRRAHTRPPLLCLPPCWENTAAVLHSSITHDASFVEGEPR
ncbi:hypothetical protein E2C01_007327 [Portunus trituberculatus]|uniref:Uncharacterized protein n=1 Tax=Portunus trituberculatus TaxID=210409 RepID=A0A5B7CYX8_PORTR|nr:hypothetical protein [Portunus trituberculatus]